jgi:hypothetical protein
MKGHILLGISIVAQLKSKTKPGNFTWMDRMNRIKKY